MPPTPSTAFFQPGAGNVYVPQATDNLIVNFSRSPNRFQLNRYVKITPVERQTGYYADFSNIDTMRLVADTDHEWPDQQERPRGTERTHRWREFSCRRYNYSFMLGQLTEQQQSNGLDLIMRNSEMQAQICMTHRTVQAGAALTTQANWPSISRSATIDALLSDSGASWYASSTTQLYIKKSIQIVTEKIIQNTGGAVNPYTDIQMVMNPTTARKMATTAEIHAYLTAHEQAYSHLSSFDLLPMFGLPPKLYGIGVTVDTTPRVTTRRDADQPAGETISWAFPDNKVAFVSRTGGMEGQEGVPSFSTLAMFVKSDDDMRVEVQTDSWNRVIKGGVSDNRDFRVVAPLSGYLLEDVSN